MQSNRFIGSADGNSVLGRVAYRINNGSTAGVNISSDEAFETRVSADIKVRLVVRVQLCSTKNFSSL
ncbi:possible Carbamoyl-phosphate synthase L chain [Synechococcus sp. CC9311]|nr:possible Carbamoyl-phosphate synthase L chain [Synechococcus sp. CC9311]